MRVKVCDLPSAQRQNSRGTGVESFCNGGLAHATATREEKSTNRTCFGQRKNPKSFDNTNAVHDQRFESENATRGGVQRVARVRCLSSEEKEKSIKFHKLVRSRRR